MWKGGREREREREREVTMGNIVGHERASFPGSSPAFCHILYIKAGEEPGNEAKRTVV